MHYHTKQNKELSKIAGGFIQKEEYQGLGTVLHEITSFFSL